MKQTFVRISAVVALYATPMALAMAQADRADQPVRGIVGGLNYFLVIVNRLSIIVIAMAFLSFLYGLWGFISADKVDHAKFKDIMIYGLGALFVMVSVVGILNVLSTSLGISPGGNFVNFPQVGASRLQ